MQAVKGGLDAPWALVLAAGEGSRLRALTTTESGVPVPKQFCSLLGERSLLDDTILRAQRIVPRQRVCAIVAAHHRSWWNEPLMQLQHENVIVQPRNRGTATGILLPLLHIVERVRDARIVILPSDHHVRDEATLQRALEEGLNAIQHDAGGIALLGVRPEFADEELGYIIPGEPCGRSLHRVAHFVEKPPTDVALSIMHAGGLWNVFILVARATALLQLIEQQRPRLVGHLRRIVQRFGPAPADADDELSALYEQLNEFDFSRHVAQPAADSLRVLKAPPCGWSDLGTVRRVAEVLGRRTETLRASSRRLSDVTPCLSLAEQLDRYRAGLGANQSTSRCARENSRVGSTVDALYAIPTWEQRESLNPH
jgi:mannose-1-phosphate guanylyltransferase